MTIPNHEPAPSGRPPPAVICRLLFGMAPVLAVAAMLPGCLSLAPHPEALPLPVANHYPAEDASILDGENAAATSWREYFADPRLRELIAEALANNRDLKSAVLRVEEARASYGIQRADQFPTLGVYGDANRSRTPAALSLTGRPLIVNEYQVGVGVSAWEIDFWGRVRSLKEAALENFLASDEARRAATISLVEQVADGYLRLRELDERIALAQQTVISHTESLRIFTRRYQVGAIPRLDVAQVETLLTQAQALLAQLEQARAAQRHALVLLVGAPVDLAVGTDSLDDQAVLRELRPGLPSALLNSRPDIAQAEHQLKAANANIGAARAAFFPNVTLTGQFGGASLQFSRLFDSASGAWNFGPSLSLPIFDGGRNRANLELTEVRRDLAVANYEKTVQVAFRDVSDALSARRWLEEQVRIQQRTLAAQTERARLARLRYDNGAAAFLEVLDSQRDLLSAQQELVQTRRALLSSRVSLYAALGGGALDSASAAETSRQDLPAPAAGSVAPALTTAHARS